MRYSNISSLNKKQKIAGGLFIIFIIICAFYYFNIENNTVEVINQEENENMQEIDNQINEEKNANEENNEEKIFVHISGAVNNEGVIELEKNSRISDAIEKAGGLKEEANLKDINLAYKLEDGMKIHIPNNTEQEEKEKENDMNENELIDYDNTGTMELQGESGTTKEETAKININKATQTELETLPGIGPSTALKIINYRKENGSFKNIEDIKNVSGIGETKFNNIKSLITV